MDDLIKVIFFLFLLWSLIGPIISKNKKQKERNHIPKDPEDKARKPLPSNEVLEELFGLKLPREFENNFELEKEDLEKSVKPLETTFDKQQWDIDYDKIASLEKDFKILQENKIISTTTKSNYAFDIKRKIKSKSSLKDAIIISEIINKPKSLRK